MIFPFSFKQGISNATTNVVRKLKTPLRLDCATSKPAIGLRRRTYTYIGRRESVSQNEDLLGNQRKPFTAKEKKRCKISGGEKKQPKMREEKKEPGKFASPAWT